MLEFFKSESADRTPHVHFTESVEESRAINEMKGPIIVLSASGMCESGRILHHLKHSVENPNDVIMIVGWMAHHTLGRRIRDKNDEVKIYGRLYKLRANVQTMNGLSAHADQAGIVASLAHLKSRLQKIIIVHGEPEQSQALEDKLRAEGHGAIKIAELFSSITLAE